MLVCPDTARGRAVTAAYAFPERHVFYRPDPSFFPPLHTVGSGKCWLAYRPESETSAYIGAGLEANTNRTITTPEALMRELQQVRKRGYAVNREECIPGIGGIAVPVESDSGEFVGAVALVPMIDDLTAENMKVWLSQLRVVADALGKVLTPEARARLHTTRQREGRSNDLGGAPMPLGA